MRFRPCIDIHNGKVKQIVGSSLQDEGNAAKENFVSEYDGAAFARMYKDAGIQGGHIILLNPAGSEYYEEDCYQAELALTEYPGGLQIGGGINAENAGRFLEMGVLERLTVKILKLRKPRADRMYYMVCDATAYKPPCVQSFYDYVSGKNEMQEDNWIWNI